MGWNWDHTYNKRLLELPNGDLVYFDGQGRRDRYRAVKEGDIITDYTPPVGYFTELFRREDGSITLKDEQSQVMVFDALGRLVKILDRNFNCTSPLIDLGGK